MRTGPVKVVIMTEREQSAELSDLVRTQRAALGLSLRAVQDRTIDPATGWPAVKYGWIRRLEQNLPGLIVPGEFELRALAAALELPYALLGDAASAQFFGIDRVYDKDRKRRALVRRVDRMSPEQLEQLRQLMDVVMPLHDESPGEA